MTHFDLYISVLGGLISHTTKHKVFFFSWLIMKQLRVIITVHSYDDIESPSAPLTPHPPNTYYQDYIQLFININVSQNFQYSIQVF